MKKYTIEEIKAMMNSFLGQCDDLSEDEYFQTDERYHRTSLSAFLNYVAEKEMEKNVELSRAKSAEEVAKKVREELEEKFLENFKL